MAESAHTVKIPWERLPPGFAETVQHTPEIPAEARPAATLVVIRDGGGSEGGMTGSAAGGDGMARRAGVGATSDGMAGPAAAPPEILLVQRIRTASFVPGAWVFPGGVVDDGDADHLAAALRETQEETSLVVPRDTAVWIAHWVTPVQEPRRYDTRFFLGAVPRDAEVQLERREMSGHLWLTAEAALSRHAAGELPMVFPTIRTLEQLRGFHSVGAAMTAMRQGPVDRLLPRLVAEEDGVRMVLDARPRGP